MKIFHKDMKVNFVDENNVLVGFETDQCCCECADWYFNDTPTLDLKNNLGHCEDRNLLNYRFDKRYFIKVDDELIKLINPADKAYRFDGGGMVIFWLTNIVDRTSLYLHLYNVQNGYYGHGFEFKYADQVLHQDCI